MDMLVCIPEMYKEEKDQFLWSMQGCGRDSKEQEKLCQIYAQSYGVSVADLKAFAKKRGVLVQC